MLKPTYNPAMFFPTLAILTWLHLAFATRYSTDRPILYLQRSANIDSNSPTSFQVGPLSCDNLLKHCSCTGQKCKLISDTRLKNITVISMKDTDFEKIPSNSFRGMANLEILELMQGSLSTISPNALIELQNLKRLNLAINQISTLHPLSFNGLDKLESLIFMKNEIADLSLILPCLVPLVLPSLNHIHLGGNPITSLQEDTFKPLADSKIEILEVIICDVQYIHPFAFRHLKHLRDLYIGANDKLRLDNLIDVFANMVNSSVGLLDISAMSFSDIPTGLLEILGRSNVSILMLSKTPMHNVVRGKFPYMPKIETLVLADNLVEFVEPNAMENLPNVKRIDFEKNIMTVFPPGLMLRSLRELDLSGFSKYSIRFEFLEYSLSNMNNLRTLKLNYKTILSLKSHLFNGLSSLEELYIRKCGITSIENGTFNPLVNLRILDISENQFFHSKPDVFAGLGGLRHLVLENAEASDVDPITWYDLTNVEILNLSKNSFRKINSIIFHLKNLRKLVLQFNKATFWEETILQVNRSLLSLDLSDNLIRRVTPVMVSDFQQLRHLNLTNNPYRCDCKQLPFIRWLEVTNTLVYKYNYRSNTGYYCNEPSIYNSVPLRDVKVPLTDSCNILERKKTSLTTLLLTTFFVLTFILGSIVSFYVMRKKIVLKYSAKDAKSNCKKYLFDAFVSYSNYDSDFVYSVFLPQLESSDVRNAKLCVYDRDFVAGKAITDCIVDGIKKSRKIILLVSQHFLESNWCKFETNLAQSVLLEENREGLVVVKLGEVDFTNSDEALKFLLQSRLYLTWSEDSVKLREFWRKLDKALELREEKSTKSSAL